ncbi:MAG: DUF547 domain-containing protein [Saonia sp.]
MRAIALMLLFISNISCGNAKPTIERGQDLPKIEPPAYAKETKTNPPTTGVQETEEIMVDTITTHEATGIIKKMVVVKETPKEKFDHGAFDKLLKTYVNANGDVDYNGFKANKAELKAYLDALSVNMPTNEWDRADVLTYWINAYNAFTIQLIIDNYPIKSIKDIKDPWGTRFFKLGTKWYNLGEIEHKILRKMGEPRIHFAINCASYSCPRLLNEAYTTAKLEGQLQEMTIDFISDTKRNVISNDRIQLSNIFKWYKKDFTTKGSLIDYINAYAKTPISNTAKVTYLKYDWSLNEAK